MKTKRKAISKSIRFEIFKRDSFKCQYCGVSAPDVVLHVDHIIAKANGGEDDLTNLITSCFDCNLGKSDRLLSENAAASKAKAQLDQLQERREQMEMMVQWKRGLLDIEEQAVQELAGIWAQCVPGQHLNHLGISGLRKLIKRYGVVEE